VRVLLSSIDRLALDSEHRLEATSASAAWFAMGELLSDVGCLGWVRARLRGWWSASGICWAAGLELNGWRAGFCSRRCCYSNAKAVDGLNKLPVNGGQRYRSVSNWAASSKAESMG